MSMKNYVTQKQKAKNWEIDNLMAKYVGFNRGRNFDSCIKPILILN